jgi:hypothetical protein
MEEEARAQFAAAAGVKVCLLHLHLAHEIDPLALCSPSVVVDGEHLAQR